MTKYELLQCVILSMLLLRPVLCFQITSTTLFIRFPKSGVLQHLLSCLGLSMKTPNSAGCSILDSGF